MMRAPPWLARGEQRQGLVSMLCKLARARGFKGMHQASLSSRVFAAFTGFYQLFQAAMGAGGAIPG